MRTLVLLIPAADDAIVERARESAIEYLGTRTIDKDLRYATGTLGLNTIITAKEKEELAEILDKQDIGVVFIEVTEAEKDMACKQKTLYLDAKLSLP